MEKIMSEYLQSVNSGAFYLLVFFVLTVMLVMCFIFLIKSYKAGVKIGMDKKVLKKAITSSATFSFLPSIAILIGVIALSGTLGIPFSWLRLSVIGALHYELQVGDMAAESIGISDFIADNMSMEAFVTIALVMTIGILGGVVCCILFLKPYLNKIRKAPKKETESKDSKPGFGAIAMSAMFTGLCATYIGSYIGKAIPRAGSDVMPLVVAIFAGATMAVFEYLIQKKNIKVLENFSLAVSMLVAMALAVLIKLVL